MALKKKISAEIKSNEGFDTYEFHVSKLGRQMYNFGCSFFLILEK
jgi:hypothetical protein